MILSRIQRGALRTQILINNKVIFYSRFAVATYNQIKRPVGLSLLAAYTATIPLHALQGSIAMADESEPPSKVVSAIAPETLASIELTGIATVHLNQMHAGKSKEDLRVEAVEVERVAQEKEAARIAAETAQKLAASQELAREQEVARQRQIAAQQQESDAARILQSVPPPPASSGGIADKIAAVAHRYNVSAQTIDLIERIATCESHDNKDAYNRSGASGVFQFMPGTWRGTQEGKAGKSPFDADANIEAGVRKMLVEGDWSAWQCYFIVRR